MPEGTAAAARQAILAVARAEIDDVGSRRKLYTEAMRAVRRARPDLKDEEVCSATFAAVTREIWIKEGRDRGVPEADCAPAKTWFWRVGESLGFTAKYSRYDADGEPNDASVIGQESSFIEGNSAGAVDPPPKGSLEVIEAMHGLRRALRDAEGFLCSHDARKLAGREACETFVAEAQALSQAALQCMAGNRTVPTGLQALLLSMVHIAQSMDALVRRFTAAWREESLDARPPLTRKALSNIIHGRLKDIPRCAEPRSLVAAALRGYHGAECPRCGSRRSRASQESLSSPMIHCIPCGEPFEAPEWGTCRACHRLLGEALTNGDVDCPHCGEPTRAPPAAAGRAWLAP